MSIYPDPVPCSQEQLNDLFPYVGKVAFTWSSAESSMDMLVALVFQSASDKPNAKDIPRAFDHKARYLRKAFRNTAVMKSFEDQGRSAVDFMLAASEQRNSLIHGVLLGYDQEHNAYEFSKLDLPNDEINRRTRHFKRRVLFTLDALEMLANRLVRVDLDLVETVERVADAIDALARRMRISDASHGRAGIYSPWPKKIATFYTDRAGQSAIIYPPQICSFDKRDPLKGKKGGGGSRIRDAIDATHALSIHRFFFVERRF